MAKTKKLTEQEQKMLLDAWNNSENGITVGKGAKSENKGWTDTPLFSEALKEKCKQFDAFNTQND